MKRKEQGFTLVELLAVIVILAIIMIIAIPAIMGTTTQAKKEAFYLYAQSVQSKAVAKYTQDLEHNTANTSCAVYDIGSDLGLPDTGSYEGWVMVTREVTTKDGGRRIVRFNFSNAGGISYARYCITKDATCTPDKTVKIEDGTKEVEIAQKVDQGYKVCANYEYVNDKKLIKAPTECKTYESSNEGAEDSYEYKVVLSMIDNDYGVEAAVVSEDMSEDEFSEQMYTANLIQKNNEASSSAKNNAWPSTFVTHAPLCAGGVDTSQVRGPEKSAATTIVTTSTTTTRTTESTRSTTTTTTRGTTIVTPDPNTTTTRGTTIVTQNPNTTTTRGTTIVTPDPNTTTTRGTTIVTPDPGNTTTTRGTTIVTQDTEPTTTIDTGDTSLLLNTLNVAGYDIGFSPLKFNYELTVPNEVTSLNVSATTTTPLTTHTISGHEQLGVGRNVVRVELFNTQTGKTSTYRIIVNRYQSPQSTKVTGATVTTTKWDPESGAPDPSLEESNANLRVLSISGYNLGYSQDIYEYTIQTHGESELKITALSEVKDATVRVTGATEITDGSVITIDIQSPNKYYKKTYKITVEFLDEDSNSTKILRGVAVGLGVVLVATLLVVQLTKNKKARKISDVMQKEMQDFSAFDMPTNGGQQGSALPQTPDAAIPQTPVVSQTPQGQQPTPSQDNSNNQGSV